MSNEVDNNFSERDIFNFIGKIIINKKINENMSANSSWFFSFVKSMSQYMKRCDPEKTLLDIQREIHDIYHSKIKNHGKEAADKVMSEYEMKASKCPELKRKPDNKTYHDPRQSKYLTFFKQAYSLIRKKSHSISSLEIREAIRNMYQIHFKNGTSYKDILSIIEKGAVDTLVKSSSTKKQSIPSIGKSKQKISKKTTKAESIKIKINSPDSKQKRISKKSKNLITSQSKKNSSVKSEAKSIKLKSKRNSPVIRKYESEENKVNNSVSLHNRVNNESTKKRSRQVEKSSSDIGQALPKRIKFDVSNSETTSDSLQSADDSGFCETNEKMGNSFNQGWIKTDASDAIGSLEPAKVVNDPSEIYQEENYTCVTYSKK